MRAQGDEKSEGRELQHVCSNILDEIGVNPAYMVILVLYVLQGGSGPDFIDRLVLACVGI